MTWNVSSELISVIILCIIWVYSRRGNPLPTLKNKLFQVCFLTTFCAMTSNIVSTYMIYNYKDLPLPLIWIITTIYFIATPLMGIVYFYYALSVLFEDQKYLKKMMLLSSIPACIYLVFVLANPFTKNIFNISPDMGYTRGKYIIITYFVFYIYCIACVFVARCKCAIDDKSIRNILTCFPIIAFLVIIIQQFYSDYILTGSAATCALLMIYLYLQNKQISIDYLLGIPNRQEFLKMLGLKLKKEKNIPFTIVVLSLKGFKLINDKVGQQNGDRILQSISGYLKETAAPCHLYRFSGDEIAILVEKPFQNQLRAILLQIRERMASPWYVEGFQCVVSGALGIIQYPDCTDNMESLINGIEYTIARAKSLSEENYCYCTPELLEKINRRIQVVEIIKERIANNNLDVFYQPILSVSKNQFSMAESLLRMVDTPLGPLYPSEFIPIAEDTGLIVEMTYQVLNKVCIYIKMLLEKGIDIDAISVNFSSVQFLQEHLEEKVTDIIAQYNIPYSKIKIEITESVLADNFEVVKEFIENMHKMGIRFGLDDFGTGYSNLTSVLQIPFDIIKLDKSLIWDSITNEKSSIMVHHLSAAFRQLGLIIWSEGVETKEQNDFAIECGSEMIQGYLYAKPMPGEQAIKILGQKLNKDNI